MGLDIYLYKYADFEETRRKEKEYEAYSDNLWKHRTYEDTPEEEKEEIRKKETEFKTFLGIEGGNNSMCENVEFPSSIHPGHLFKVGYFRSSYNDSGINRILETICGKTLRDIFKSDETDMYYIKPDWENALQMVNDLMTKLSDHMKKIGVSVSSVSIPIGGSTRLPSSTNEALTLYIEEFLRGNVPFGGGAYSNSVGLFSIKDPQKVKAFIPGVKFNHPCVYIVYEAEGFNWYAEALEIVKETIEYVLAQPDSQKYYLHWSG